jgi:hypothetical protein
MPLILSGLSLSQPVSTSNPGFKEHTASKANSVLVAGGFKYFDVEVTVEVEKICIIAYHGDSLPEPKDRSVGNYYRWEYDHGIWKDVSGHDSVYIKPSQCVKNDNTYSFYIGIDNKVKTGHWTVKILIDDDEVEYSTNSLVVVAQFNFFLTALISVYAPINSDKKSIVDIDFICSNRKRVMIESKEKIDKLVDEILSKHAASDQEEDTEEIHDLCFLENKQSIEDELVKSTVSTYHKSKLKIEQTNAVNSLFFNKKCGGGNVFRLNKSGGYRRFLAITFAIILLSAVFVPIITPQDTTSSFYPIISSFDISPEEVNLNDSIWLNVSVSDSVGITSVVADIDVLETINLSLIEGTIVNDTAYSGFWQNIWLVQNVDPGDYIVEVVVLNRNNRSVSQQCVFTVLPSADANNSINNSLEPEFIESMNANQSEEQNNTSSNNNETFQNETANNTVNQNIVNDTIDNTNFPESNTSNVNEGFSTGITTENIIQANQTEYQMENESTIFIVDKRHEDISVLPGTRFYVERTIDGPHGTNVIFVPMFSDDLTLESIEIVENIEKNIYSACSSDSHIFDAGKARCQKEQEIDQLKETLPPEIKTLNKIAYTDDIELQSPRTIRMWFRAPSWEEIQSNLKLSSGEISYLVFSDDINSSFDFEGSTWWNSNWLYRKEINVTTGANTPYNGYNGYTVRLTGLNTTNTSKFQSDGDDIRIVYWNGIDNVELDREINNSGTSNTTVIFKLQANISANSYDNNYSLYYGNSTVGAGPSNQSNIYLWFDNASSDRESEYAQGRVDATAHGGAWADSIAWNAAGYYTFDTGNDFADSFRPTNLDERDIYIEYEEYQTGAYPTDMTSGPLVRWDGTGSGSTEDSSHWYYYEMADSAYQGGSYASHDDITADDRGSVVVVYGTLGTFPQTTWTRLGLASWDVNPTNLKEYYNNDSGGWNGSRFSGSHDAGSDNENPGQFGFWIQQDAGRLRNIIARRYTEPEPSLTIGSEEIGTSVDTISPYNVTYSPLAITATGNSNLDYVTLWYRWSNNNFTGDQWTTLTYDDFEDGFGNYSDGGGDCGLYTGGTYAHQGSNAANIQDNSGDASSFYHTSGIDVDTLGYTNIKVDFWFVASTGGGGWNNGEDWFVEYYNGTGWQTVATYVYGTDFTVGSFYHEIVWINETDYSFPSNMQIKFRCDASGNNDDIYIDEIYVNATPTSTNWAVWNNVSNPDTFYPWNWSFNFPNSTGYYEFYSIGNKSGSPNETAPGNADAICYYNLFLNNAPAIDLITPENGSANVDLQPSCQIWAKDVDGDTLTVYWYENTTGEWVLRNTNSSVSANSIVSYNFTQFSSYYTTYWWKVIVNDSIDNTTKIYHFTTKPINTSVDPITPYEVLVSSVIINATGISDFDNVSLWYRWSNNNFTGDQWTTLTYDDFEDGFGNYSDGGGDCDLYTGGTYAHQGSNAAEIRDDAGDESAFFHTSGLDVHTPSYKCIKVEFWFQTQGFSGSYDFFVEYFDGTTWQQVANYVYNTDFQNGVFYHKTVWINESTYNFPTNMQIKFRCDAWTNNELVYIDEIYVNATANSTEWIGWNDVSNPDTEWPWSWNFDFPTSVGYYEFYSIGKKSGSPDENPPDEKDAACYHPGVPPVINSYDLRNITGSKLNNATGLLDVNNEYYFLINVTDENSWEDIEYINITAWYDNGSNSSTYNQTLGGNLNMFLQYENITGTANFSMLWPNDEVQLILTNCTETIIDSITRLINFSFKPLSQVRWASSNYTWNSTGDAYNDPYSWNFNITVVDTIDIETCKVDEYGVYKYTLHSPNQDWVDVYAAPGFNDTSSVVTITYSSNYDFNMSIYFEENLYNSTYDETILIANNVDILADADPNDDITSDITFSGIGEANAVDIFNVSGFFQTDNVSQTVNVQFDVYIPIGTLGIKYTARVATKIVQN